MTGDQKFLLAMFVVNAAMFLLDIFLFRIAERVMNTNIEMAQFLLSADRLRAANDDDGDGGA